MLIQASNYVLARDRDRKACEAVGHKKDGVANWERIKNPPQNLEVPWICSHCPPNNRQTWNAIWQCKFCKEHLCDGCYQHWRRHGTRASGSTTPTGR